MKKFVISLVGVWAVVLAVCRVAEGAASAGLMPPFYPESKAPATYEPGKLIPNKAAVIELPTGAESENDFIETFSLNGEWKFSGLERGKTPFADESDLSKGFEKPGFNDSSWDSIPVPLNFYIKYKYDVKAPYVKGWYRKELSIPKMTAGRRAILHFGVVGYEALLFVNGHEAGRHHGDFTPWDVDITDKIEPGKPVVLALRVFSDLGPNKYIGASALITTSTHPYGSQYGLSNIKGGMWRSAELRIVPALRVERAFINPDLAKSSILVAYKIINNGLVPRVVDLYGTVQEAEAKSKSPSPAPASKLTSLTVAPGVSSFEVDIPLKNPKLWTPDEPNLYHLVLALIENGRTASVKTERFGFRSFKIEGDHFLLNGKRVYLFGDSIEVANTFENGKSEKDQPDANPEAFLATARIFLGFKSRGINAIRLSEQPVAEVVLDLADEVGMMIYDMWAWAYGSKLDPSFEKNDFEEVTEWVQRDYNHPSVVMWLGGNEVKCDQNCADIFSRQTQLIRSLERSGRPVSVFSGSAEGFAGDFKLDTDLLDLHNYLGLGPSPWPFFEKHFQNGIKKNVAVYAAGGETLNMPFVVWEVVGFSWGGKYADYTPGDVDAYLKWAKGPTSWGSPNGIGWAGSIGLASALDSQRGRRHGMEMIGHPIMDFIRQDTRVSAVAPWFCQYSITLPLTSLWTQPVYSGLRIPNGFPLRNVFTGKTYLQSAYIVNSSNENYEGATARITLAEADGSESVLAEWTAADVKPWQKMTRELALTIPASKQNRWSQLRIRVLAKNGVEISRNFYDVFVQNWEEATAPLESQNTIGVLSCGASGAESLSKILKTLDVKNVEISKPDDLSSCRLLIIPPSKTMPQGLDRGSPMTQAIHEWVQNGGTLLVMEQRWSGEFPLIFKSLRDIPVVFADVVVPSHPAFNGLSQPNFEFWNNPRYAETASFVYAPIASDVIVARGPMLSLQESFSVLSEGKMGQGRIIASQFDACGLWGSDSAATVYLRNLFLAALSAPPSSIRPWSENANDFKVSKNSQIISIDLRAQANMGFKDDQAGDNKGGWADQGNNDFRMMPLGRKTFRGVPFEIIDPASNGGKSCLVLKYNPEGDFIADSHGIKVGQKLSRIFFLHGEALAEGAGDTLKYRINYKDGRSQEIATAEGISISDWWNCKELSGAKLAFTSANANQQEVGLFAMEWTNPRPDVEIESLDIFAPKRARILSMVVSISGEKFLPQATY